MQWAQDGNRSTILRMNYPDWFPIAFFGTSAWVSLGLIGTMWLKHRKAHRTKKIFWSILLCLPLLGWVFYCALFFPPRRENGYPENNSAFTSGGFGSF